MCGIFGVINYSKKQRYMQDLDNIKDVIRGLLISSQVRGTDASGVCIVDQRCKAYLIKNHCPGSQLTSNPDFVSIMKDINYHTNFKYAIGHTRAKTKGTQYLNVNNHPIVSGKVVGVHNGMISNDEDIFRMDKELVRKGTVDSEVIFSLLDNYISKKNRTITYAVTNTTDALIGSFSCAFFHTNHPNYVTLFTGSFANIVIYDFKDKEIMIFASSDTILERALEDIKMFERPSSKRDVAPNSGIRINTKNGKLHTFPIGPVRKQEVNNSVGFTI